VTFVTSAYYISNLYGRGAWTEFVAVSAIPPLVAAGMSIVRSERFAPLPSALFATSAIVWSGSHNITLAWGTIARVATLLCLRLLLRKPLAVGRRQLAWVLGLLALALCVNAWFLLPDALYSGRTQIVDISKFSWNASRDFNTPRALFDPIRYVPSSSTTPALYVQAPVWMLAWALAATALLRSRLGQTLRRAIATVAIVLVGILALIMVRALWRVVPTTLQLIQIPYRLNTYVAMLIATLVLVGVLAVESLGAGRARHTMSAALGAAMAITVSLGVWQLWVPDTHTRTRMPRAYSDRRDAFISPHVAPRTWYDTGAYLDAAEPVVPYPPDRVLRIDPTGIDGNKETLTVRLPPGPAPFAITMGAGPEVVELRGLVRLGRTRTGYTVARRPDRGTGPVRITLQSTSAANTVGVALSVVGLLGLAGLMVGAVVARRRVP
jgi:hypothetical protein